MFNEMYVTGTQVNYYFICKTKLWFFSHNITMEREHDNVKAGKLLHREHFKRDDREVRIGPIALDIVRKGDKLEIREIKKSKKMEDAHVYQTLYYLYILNNYGIDARAVLSFPESKENIELELDEHRKKELENILNEIDEIAQLPEPPKPQYRKMCRKCAYFEFCFS